MQRIRLPATKRTCLSEAEEAKPTTEPPQHSARHSRAIDNIPICIPYGGAQLMTEALSVARAEPLIPLRNA